MKRKISVVSVFLLVLVGLCLSAYSSYAFSGHHGRGGELRHLKWALEKGGQPLTEDQKVQVREIMKNTWTALKPTIDQIRAGRKDLRDTILSGTATDEQVKAKVAAMIPLGTTAAEQRALAFNQIVGKVLTDGQRTLLQQFKGNRCP
ncbi:MAG TPA: Spy/CpxP family protein refolding chaperone, partial [Thermodesulfobacteriota bacterium]|nr:Spy/CpxP family protein refolding chaperone [Thermodesulfobacteriota bacterium]